MIELLINNQLDDQPNGGGLLKTFGSWKERFAKFKSL